MVLGLLFQPRFVARCACSAVADGVGLIDLQGRWLTPAGTGPAPKAVRARLTRQILAAGHDGVDAGTGDGQPLSLAFSTLSLGNRRAVLAIDNAIDTTTTDIDLVAETKRDLGRGGGLNLSAAFNYNKTKLDRIAATPPAVARRSRQARLAPKRTRLKARAGMTATDGGLAGPERRPLSKINRSTDR